MLLTIITATACVWRDTNKLIIEHFNGRPDRITRELHGLRFVHISDLHTRYIGYLEKNLVSQVSQIKPDLILVTGDFVNSNDDIVACGELLKSLQEIAPIVAILGNHDHWFMGEVIDVEKLISTIKMTGTILLGNEAIEMRYDANDVYIIGLDDNHLGLHDYSKAINGVPPEATKILLAHSPEIAEQTDLSNIDLVLCGHRHGGQIMLPFFAGVIGNSVWTHFKGFYNVAGVEDKRYVTGGVGASFIPIRFGTRAEIAVFDF
jgi:hypothetical protein